jgi:hypothetical protein
MAAGGTCMQSRAFPARRHRSTWSFGRRSISRKAAKTAKMDESAVGTAVKNADMWVHWELVPARLETVYEVGALATLRLCVRHQFQQGLDWYEPAIGTNGQPARNSKKRLPQIQGDRRLREFFPKGINRSAQGCPALFRPRGISVSETSSCLRNAAMTRGGATLGD